MSRLQLDLAPQRQDSFAKTRMAPEHLRPNRVVSTHPLDFATQTWSAQPRPIFEVPDPDTRSESPLECLLTHIVDSPLKVRVLELFLTHPGLTLSTPQLAKRLEEPLSEVQSAVEELAAARAMNYCPSYGHSDLCSVYEQYWSRSMMCGMTALLDALRNSPQIVWGRWE